MRHLLLLPSPRSLLRGQSPWSLWFQQPPSRPHGLRRCCRPPPLLLPRLPKRHQPQALCSLRGLPALPPLPPSPRLPRKGPQLSSKATRRTSARGRARRARSRCGNRSCFSLHYVKHLDRAMRHKELESSSQEGGAMSPGNWEVGYWEPCEQ